VVALQFVLHTTSSHEQPRKQGIIAALARLVPLCLSSALLSSTAAAAAAFACFSPHAADHLGQPVTRELSKKDVVVKLLHLVVVAHLTREAVHLSLLAHTPFFKGHSTLKVLLADANNIDGILPSQSRLLEAAGSQAFHGEFQGVHFLLSQISFTRGQAGR